MAVVLVGWNLHAFLAQNAPVGASILVVEGWMDPEGLDQAIGAVHSGRYEHVLTTGGPIASWPGFHGDRTYAERAANYLVQHGVAKGKVTAVPAPASAQDRTFLSAVMVREWAKRSRLGPDALDIFSSGTHARRSRLLYRLAFGPDVAIGVYAARSSAYDPHAWWRTSLGTRDVLEQAVELFWVKMVFRTPPRNSDEELWAMPPRKVAAP